MLFAISYYDSEVINNVSRQQPFQFIKQTVVIKYNIPSALVESQELLSLTCDFKYFHEVQCSINPSIFCFDLELHLSKLISSLSGCPICP